MLDFVPNHTALDHPWVRAHPDFYIQGSERSGGARNYRGSRRIGAASAMDAIPISPAGRTRCSSTMPMPALQAAQMSGAGDDRRAMRRRALRHGDAAPARGLPAHLGPDAGAVLAQGDRRGAASAIPASRSWPKPIGISNGRCSSRASTTATTSGSTTDFARAMPAPFAPISAPGSTIRIALARFLENHDEPRAAATFSWPKHRAAAIVTYFAPGLRFFHQGQREGARVRVPVHLCRAPVEAPDAGHRRLLRQAPGRADVR